MFDEYHVFCFDDQCTFEPEGLVKSDFYAIPGK